MKEFYGCPRNEEFDRVLPVAVVPLEFWGVLVYVGLRPRQF